MINLAGAVYIFTVDNNSSWTKTDYLQASNASEEDEFGYSVALSADGKTLAVAARGKDNFTGAAYIFTVDNNSSWTETDYLKASNAGEQDEFGYSVALSADGKTLAVGAYRKDNFAGAAYIFTYNSSWTETDYLKASNAGIGDQFGRSVALSADGQTLAVGASGKDDDAGAAYIFTVDNNSSWTETDYLKASNAGIGDQFGRSVALSADGKTLAVGANEEESNATGINGDQNNDGASLSGAVYLY